MIGIKVACYRKKDWNRFLNMIDDKERMHSTWREWHTDFEKGKNELIKQGFQVEDVVVDLDELAEYCMLRGIKNDGKARSAFVQEK